MIFALVEAVKNSKTVMGKTDRMHRCQTYLFQKKHFIGQNNIDDDSVTERLDKCHNK